MENTKEKCPHCKKDLQGGPIPKEQQQLYGSTHYSNKIGIYSVGLDMTAKWECPYCKKQWNRNY